MADTTRIVVVDDHRMVLDTLVRALGVEPDIEVVAVADSVASALVEVRRHEPHVVVLDFHLRDGSSADAITQFKAAVPGIEVVVLTGDTDSDSVLAAIDTGCMGFVTKDQAVHELVNAVRAARRGEPAIAPSVLRRLVRRNERRGTMAALTARELIVLERLAAGATSDSIARELFVSASTVRNHIQRLLTKLAAHSKLEAVVKGVSAGLVKIGDPQ